MEENQISHDTTESVATTTTLASESETSVGADSAASIEIQPKKKSPVILFAIIGVVLIAIIAIAASTLFANPKAAVTKAFVATVSAQEKRVEQIANDIPAIKLAMEPQLKPGKTNFSLNFESIEGDLAPEEQAIVNLLSGLAIKGDYTMDPENSISEVNSSIALGGADLLGMYIYSSPDLLAGNVPTFSDAVLSVNPKTFAADAKASPVYAMMGLDDAQLDEVQKAIDTQINSVNSMAKIDVKKMQEDMKPIGLKAVANATFTKGAKENGLQLYTVTIPGADVKTALFDLVKYIYLDSQMADIYKSAFTPELLGGQSYEDFMNTEVIGALQTEMPDLDTVVTLKVNKTIKAANIQMTPVAAQDGAAAGSGSLVMDYIIADDGSEKVTMNGSYTEEGTTANFMVDVADKYENGLYNTDIAFTVDGSADFTMAVTANVKMDKSGAYGLAIDTKIKDGATMDSVITYNMDGTIKVDGDNIACDFPTITGSGEVDGKKYTLNLSAKADTAPVTTPYAITKEHKAVFSMSESELIAIAEEYSVGSQALTGQLFGMFMGGSMGAIPETAESAPVEPAA
ncbi:hypothetical protein V6615_12860 [Oscillospiraceae bacterium PP1C4]